MPKNIFKKYFEIKDTLTRLLSEELDVKITSGRVVPDTMIEIVKSSKFLWIFTIKQTIIEIRQSLLKRDLFYVSIPIDTEENRNLKDALLYHLPLDMPYKFEFSL